MKAKRLTALALAAVMAASSMSVSFAAPTEDLVLDFAGPQLYKEDEDGYIVPASGMDDFRPGDSIYLQLDEYPNASTKEIDRVKAHADWEVGKSWVEKVSIIWKRGSQQTTTSHNYTYSFTGTGILDGWEETDVATPSNSNDKTAVKNALKSSAKANDYVTKYKNENFITVSNIFTDKNNKYYSTQENALKTFYAGKIAETTTDHWSYSTFTGATKAELIAAAGLTAVNSNGYIYNNKYYAQLADVTGADGLNLTITPNQTIWVLKADETKTSGSGHETTDPSNTTTHTQIDNVSTFEHNGTKYWFKDEAGEIALLTAASFGVQTIAGSDYANGYYKADKSLVKDSELKNNPTTETKYDGKDEAAAIADAGIKAIASGTIAKNAKEGDAFVTDADAQSRQAVDAAIDALDITIKDTPKTNTETVRSYWFKIDTKKSASTKDIDVYGDLYLSTSSSLSTAKRNGNHISVDITLTNASSDPEHSDVSDYALIEPGAGGVLSFDKSAEEVEIEFGDDARFEFNARGQGKLNFAYNTKYNREFARDYESANIDFITFEGEPTANRTGTLYIYVDPEDKGYIYEVTEDGAKKISGAKYDKDEGAWVIRTRKLTSYAISDKKLKTVDEMGTSSSSGTTGGSTSRPNGSTGKPNPDTGR